MSRWVWLACLALTLVKLWLTASQTVHAIGPSTYDDLHFLTQASHLLRGEWLGPYDNLTLIKGPFFPAWIAFAFVLGIPLLLSAQLLYALACWVMTMAVRPVLTRNVLAVVFFGALLFNPESNAAHLTRVLRQIITPALTTMVGACAFGLLLTHETGGRQAPWWSVGLGASFAALWLTREEQLAVVAPALLFVFGCAALLAWKQGTFRAAWRMFRWWLVSLGLWAVIVYSVASVNYAEYGLFNKTEFDAPSFIAAYGALARVKPAEFKPLVPVSKETRRRIYHVSPAAAELKPYLEGLIGARWERESEYQQEDSNRNEILGGWFMWALRGAVQEAGYYDGGRYPAEFYLRLTREVDAACERRELDCYGPRSTLLPVWHNHYARLWLPTFGNKLAEMIGFRAVGLDPIPSRGRPEELVLFRGLTGNEITPPDKYYVEVEAAASDSQIQFLFRDEQGVPVPFSSSRSASPDLGSYLTTRGWSVPAAGNARYLLAASCSDRCSLEIRAAGALLESIGFSDLKPTLGLIEKEDMVYRVLSFEHPAAPLPEAARLGATRLAGLRGILRVYQVVHPILAIAAVIVYLLVTINVIRGRTGGSTWMLLSGLLVLTMARVALISFMHVASLRIPPGSYLEEAHPTLLAFVALACLAAMQRSAGLRPS